MPLPLKDNEIHRPSIRDEVYSKVLNWILEGVLMPGEKIVDKDLALHLGVSRTPVREALRRLEDKNLVESSANRWTRVSKIPSKEPEMIYPIIQVLEKLAISQAMAGITEEDLAKMARANTDLKTALEKKDPVAASRADADFHDVFIARSQNDHLIQILKDLKIRFRRLETTYFKGLSHDPSSIKDHAAIILALRARDMETATGLIHSNWEKSLERLRPIKP